jgi:hypothetical protein
MTPLSLAITDQHERVLRFYSRITRENKTEPDYLDDLWSFFQNCWHLKDWIKNDPNILATMAECPSCKKNQKILVGRTKCLECEVNDCKYLPICADLANGSKHLRLNTPRTDARMIGKIEVRIADSICTDTPNGSTTYTYFVFSNNMPSMMALDLAGNSIQEWNTLLKSWGLL